MKPPTIGAAIFLENQGWLLNFVKTLVADVSVAEDIVQSTFEQALHNKEGKGAHRGWLRSVAHNLVLQRNRSGGRRRERELRGAERLEADRVDDAIVENPRQVSELASLVMGCIETLPPVQQKVLLLRYMSNHKPAVISKKLDIPVERVYRLLERGCDSVRNRLKIQHGIDWRVNCAAIIGFRLPTASTTAVLKPLAIAAALSLTVGGLWFGIGASATVPSTETSIMAGFSGRSAALDASDFADAESPVAAAPVVERVPETVPLNQFFGVLVKVQDEANQLHAGVEVEAIWTDPVSGLARRTDGVTGTDGFAVLPIAHNAPEVLVFARPNECFATGFAQLTPTMPATVVSLPVVKGSFEQTLVAVDYLGRGVPNIRLLLESTSGYRVGYVESGANGVIQALFPGPGIYRIGNYHHSVTASQAFPAQTFSIGTETIGRPIEVRCSVPPTDVRVRCTDASTGAPITTVSYQGTVGLIGEYGEALGARIYSLESSNGILQYGGWESDREMLYFTASAPGYQTAKVYVRQNPEPGSAIEVKLLPVDYLQARIILENPQRMVEKATITQSVNLVQWPPLETSDPGWGRTTLELPLELSEEGYFKIPSPHQPCGTYLGLKIDDDLGHHWNSVTQDYSQLVPGPSGVLNFRFASKPEHFFTLAVFSADGSPVVGEQIFCRSLRLGGPSSRDAATDESGELRFKAFPGDTHSLVWTFGDLRINGNFTTPELGEPFRMELHLPPFDSQLEGTVTLPGGEAPGICPIDANLPQAITMQTANGVETLLHFSVRGGTTPQGSFLIEGIPSGSYETTVRRNRDVQVTAIHFTDAEHEYILPISQRLDFEVWLEGGTAPSNGRVSLCRSFESGSRFISFKTLDQYGKASIHNTLPPAETVAVIHSLTYEPYVLSSPFAGQINYVTLVPGRTVDLFEASAALDIATEAETIWLVDTWDGATDPRQRLVIQDRESGQLALHSAPAEAFHFVEIDANGLPTGRRILVPVNGPPVRADL